MFKEARLALLNTNNLMYQKGLVGYDDLINAISSDQGVLKIEMDEMARSETLFDVSYTLQCNQLEKDQEELEEKIKTIVQKLKENTTNGN